MGARASRLRTDRENAKPSLAGSGHGAKMAFVEGGELTDPVAAGDHDDGRVREADAEVEVLLDQSACLPYVAGTEGRESVCSGGLLV